MAIKRILDVALNDSDKSWTVPGSETWKICYGHIVFTSTATVGNRRMKMIITDENGVEVMDTHAGAVQAASVAYDYEFMQGIFRETTFIDNALQVPISHDLILLPGWTIRFYDKAAIDAAQDDMVVSFVVNTHNV